jgi:DME family drug/metabolite transporter
MRHRRAIGLLQILLSGFCFGFLGVFGKRAYELGLSPGQYLSLRFLLASAVLGLVLIVVKPSLLRVSRNTLFRCILLGVTGYAIFSSCYFYALRGLSASLTVLLLYTYPVLVSLGARVIFGERQTKAQWLALPIVMGGMALLVGGDLEMRSLSFLAFGFGSAIFYAFYILASGRLLVGVPPLSSTFYIMLSAGVALSLLHLREIPWSVDVALVVSATALISTLAAMGLFLAALQKLKSAEASLLSAMEPVTAVILAVVLLGERLRWSQGLGGILIFVGLAMVALATRHRVSAE